MFPELGPDLQKGKRMIDILANKYAYLPQKTSARLFVRQARLDESQMLDISRNAPVLVLNSRLTSRSGNICEISTATLRSDLVSLGLIYDLVDLGDAGLRIDMTLTTPGCPVSDVLPREAEAAVQAALADVPIEVNLVWDPPWTPDRLTPEALDQLGYRPAKRESSGGGLSVRRRHR
mgnify:CR=1 FL=1